MVPVTYDHGNNDGPSPSDMYYLCRINSIFDERTGIFHDENTGACIIFATETAFRISFKNGFLQVVIIDEIPLTSLELIVDFNKRLQALSSTSSASLIQN